MAKKGANYAIIRRFAQMITAFCVGIRPWAQAFVEKGDEKLAKWQNKFT